MRETFVSQSHHYSFAWFLGFSLWPTFHFALQIASLFALGTWPLFLWPGKWLWVLVFPDFVEVHAVGGVCFLHNGASSEGSLEHRCPDGSSVRCPERFSSFSSWGWALESVPLPCPPLTFGESQSSGLRVILVQECFLDFAFWHFPCIYHPYYSFWDLTDLFWGQGLQVIYSSVYLLDTIHSPSPIQSLSKFPHWALWGQGLCLIHLLYMFCT